jgi:hypothetical protein
MGSSMPFSFNGIFYNLLYFLVASSSSYTLCMESQTSKLFDTDHLIDPPAEHQLVIEELSELTPLDIGEVSLVASVQVTQVH